MRLFVGDDWAEDHHDVELMDAAGRRLAKARLPEGVASIARQHAMLGGQLGKDAEEDAGQVAVGIETDRGPWVQALTDLDTDRIHRRSVLNSLINEYTRVA